jgi:hypothetical protein
MPVSRLYDGGDSNAGKQIELHTCGPSNWAGTNGTQRVSLSRARGRLRGSTGQAGLPQCLFVLLKVFSMSIRTQSVLEI